MTWIQNCEVPDLSEFEAPVLGEYTLNIVFLAAGAKDRKAQSYVTNFILAVDKAIREYIGGRECLVKYASSANRTSLLIEGLSRFDTCINTVKRSLRFVDRLASHPAGPEVQRLTRRLLKNNGELITSVRGATEHMDEFIQLDKLKEGEPHVLSITQDSEFLEIAGYRLSFEKLAQVLRRLRELASEFARFKEEVNDNVEA